MQILNKKKHARLWTPKGAMEANDRFVSAIVSASPIVLWGNKYICTQCHYGPGLWTKNFGVTWDKHEDLQIEISLQGNFDFDIEGKKVRIHSGEALVISAGRRHIWRTPTSGFMLGMFIRALSPEGENHTVRLKKDADFGVVKPSVLSKGLVQLANLTSQKVATEFDVARIQAWHKLIVAEILESTMEADSFKAETVTADRSIKSAHILRNVIEEIDRRIAEPLLVEDLARSAGVSERQLNRLFVEFKGESVHRFILNRRLLKARSLIEKDPSLPIKAVAAESGFADASHLGNAFRRSFYISPGRFAASLIP